MIRVGKFSSVLFLLLAVFTGLLPFAVPQICQEALREGLVLCGGPLLLSLFPFLVVSSLLIQCPAGERLAVPFRPVVRLIGLDNHCAARVLMIGFLGGFAPAASAAAEAVRTGQMTEEEADALLPACVCSGPSFVILTVGRYLLGSTELGICLFVSQILAGYLSAAVLFRLHPCRNAGTPAEPQSFPTPRLDRILASATQTYLKLCGFVLYFRILTAGAGAIFPQAVGTIAAILLEVCAGCSASAGIGFWGSALCCASLSVQGLSVLLQIRTICPVEMTLRPLYQARLLHLPLSLAFFYLLMPAGEQDVFRTLRPRVVLMNRVPTDCALLVFAACCVAASALTSAARQINNDITS